MKETKTRKVFEVDKTMEQYQNWTKIMTQLNFLERCINIILP